VGRVRPENVECAGQCEQGGGSPGKRLDVEGRGVGKVVARPSLNGGGAPVVAGASEGVL
jgi:hypothetical protein